MKKPGENTCLLQGHGEQVFVQLVFLLLKGKRGVLQQKVNGILLQEQGKLGEKIRYIKSGTKNNSGVFGRMKNE